MGQLHIALLIMIFCVLGIAVSAHIISVQGLADQTERQQVVADLDSLAHRAQEYYYSGEAEGGGAKSFIGLTSTPLGISRLHYAGASHRAYYVIAKSGNTRCVEIAASAPTLGLNPLMPMEATIIVTPGNTAIHVIN